MYLGASDINKATSAAVVPSGSPFTSSRVRADHDGENTLVSQCMLRHPLCPGRMVKKWISLPRTFPVSGLWMDGINTILKEEATMSNINIIMDIECCIR